MNASDPSVPVRSSVAPGSGALRGARRLAGRLPVLQIAALLVLYLVGQAAIDGYGSQSSILSMLVLASFLGIAAAGQTFAILLGGIDLSVPFLIGAGNVLVSQLSGGKHWPFALAVLFIVAMAFAVGAANGYISHRFEIHPLIVTLGVGSMVGGGVLVWTHARLTGSAPSWLGELVSPGGDVAGIAIPPVVLLWLVLALVVVLVLSKTRAGRELYATGANPAAARLALVSTTRVWTGAFAASAVCAALAGILLAGFSGTGLFDIGTPYLFTTIASVVIGGTSLLGARGDYLRTVLGALILTQITTLLIGMGLSAAMQQAVLGIVIVLVVATYARESHVRDRI
jgi:ribose transport system permease protein